MQFYGTLSQHYLTGDSKCVAQLGLPGPKLPKHLCDGARLNSTCKEPQTQFLFVKQLAH